MQLTPGRFGKKVQLINAPLASLFSPSIRAGAFPPLHLASLAASLRRGCPEVEVEIIDGEVCALDGILSRLNANIVGISCNSLTYDAALKVAESAKQKGAYVVLGGAHPTFMGRQIVSNRPFVDAVIYGDGERALLSLVGGIRYSDIPNFIYREGNRVRVTREVKETLDDLPAPDYAGVALEPYFQTYRRLYPDKPFQRAFTANSAKGCQWRDRSGGCVFCAIQHPGFRIKSPKQFWNELILIRRAWGADFFWDVSDTFTMQREWVRQFATEKPRGADFQFQVYARASDIDEHMAGLLAGIGTYEVFLGLESGSNEALHASRKGVTVRSNLQAVRNLNREGVRVIISIIIGLPHESEDTLAATTRMVEDILAWGELSEINCSILLPLPGSHVMTLLDRQVPQPAGNEDLFDLEALRRMWTERFCDVSYERLIDVQGQMRKLHHRVGTFGLTVSEQVRQHNVEPQTALSPTY